MYIYGSATQRDKLYLLKTAGQAYKILVPIADVQNFLENPHVDVSSWARGQNIVFIFIYSKTCVKGPLSKRPKIGFQDQLSLNTGQKYCRMFQGEHSAILWTFIKLPFAIEIFVLSIFEWPFYTGFTVHPYFVFCEY